MCRLDKVENEVIESLVNLKKLQTLYFRDVVTVARVCLCILRMGDADKYSTYVCMYVCMYSVFNVIFIVCDIYACTQTFDEHTSYGIFRNLKNL